jgi:carboxylate-amine ligase
VPAPKNGDASWLRTSNVMSVERPSFTIGIEEEYLVVDRESRDLIKRPPKEMWDRLGEVLGSKVTPEFLKAQIEVGTKDCANVKRSCASTSVRS